MSADNTTTKVIVPGVIIPLPIVLATAVPVKAPTKFKTAASIIAVLSGRTPVLTTVAIALAVSWNPLIKSKIRATIITVITSESSMVLRVLNYNS
jgi:hypothetical protein